MNGVNVRVVGTKIVVEAEVLQAIAGGVGDITECASRVPGQRLRS